MTGAVRPTGTTPIIDWYSPRLLIPVLTILGLCVLDGLLTVTLMKHGAAELNPVMALFLPHNLMWFAFVKLGLTGVGLCVLVACSRMKLFRRIPGETVVYGVLVVYLWLVSYELRMLELVATLNLSVAPGPRGRSHRCIAAARSKSTRRACR